MKLANYPVVRHIEGTPIYRVPLDRIKANPDALREPTDSDIETLVADIGINGHRNPITIRPNGRLIDGTRRVAALRRLRKTEVDVHIVEL